MGCPVSISLLRLPWWEQYNERTKNFATLNLPPKSLPGKVFTAVEGAPGAEEEKIQARQGVTPKWTHVHYSVFLSVICWIWKLYVFRIGQSTFSVLSLRALLLLIEGLLRPSISTSTAFRWTHDCKPKQEGKATTAFYTHPKCRWNQYPTPPQATASKKWIHTAFKITPTLVYIIIKSIFLACYLREGVKKTDILRSGWP